MSHDLFLGDQPSPIGDLKIMWSDAGLHFVEFADSGHGGGGRFEAANRNWKPSRAPTGLIAETPYPDAFERYFNGELDAFDDFTLIYEGTSFQNSVWAELLKITPGTTASYGELAKNLGQPGASRAVGSANHNNPIGIIIPCHRVIGADGSMTGYGGGMERKHWLLAHEGAILL